MDTIGGLMAKLGKRFFVLLCASSLVCIVSCGPGPSTKQSGVVNVSGTIKGYTGSVIFSRLTGGIRLPVDTVMTDSAGRFSYLFATGCQKGVYIIHWDKSGEKNARVIVDNENITFTATNHLLPKITYINSPVNQAFTSYLNTRNEMITKIDILGKVLAFYPDTDPFYTNVQNQFVQLQQQYRAQADDVINRYPGTFAARYIASDMLPKVFQVPDVQTQKKQWFDHWLDSVDFADTVLLNSSFFGDKLTHYLRLSRESVSSQKEWLALLGVGVDTLLHRTVAVPEVYDYMVSLLLEQLRDLPFQQLKDKIVAHYQSQRSCNHSKPNDLAEQLANVQAGKKAPGFILDGGVALDDIKSGHTLIFFWSAECPYCKTLIPTLKHLYDSRLKGQVAVVTVCVDDKEQIRLHPGWYKAAVQGADRKKQMLHEYAVFGTPAMYLLDAGKKIIAAPVNDYGLLQEIEHLGI